MTTKRSRVALLTLLLLPGCKKEPVAQQAPSNAAELDGGLSVAATPPVDAGPRRPLASPRPPATDDPAGRSPSDQDCSWTAFHAGLDEGRKAFADKRYDDAVTSFARAVKVRPVDARARGELGYAQLHAGRLEDADTNLRVGAELAASEPKLAAQIWFNRGLVAEKQKKREIARASFAVSDQLNSTGATRAKLKDQSRCPVAIEPAPPGVEKLTIVSGWKGVHASLVERLMGGEDGEKERGKEAPATEEEAKRRACVSYTLREKLDSTSSCDGPGPFEIQTGHMMYRDFITVVTPLSGGRFALVDVIRGGGGPASGSIHGEVTLAGDRLLVVTTMGEAHFVAYEGGCISDSLDPALLAAGGIGYGDVRSTTSNDFVVYDTNTGRAVVTGVAWGENTAQQLKLSPTTLEIKEAESTKTCGSNVTKL